MPALLRGPWEVGRLPMTGQGGLLWQRRVTSLLEVTLRRQHQKHQSSTHLRSLDAFSAVDVRAVYVGGLGKPTLEATLLWGHRICSWKGLS